MQVRGGVAKLKALIISRTGKAAPIAKNKEVPPDTPEGAEGALLQEVRSVLMEHTEPLFCPPAAPPCPDVTPMAIEFPQDPAEAESPEDASEDEDA